MTPWVSKDTYPARHRARTLAAMRGWLRETTGGLPDTFWFLWSGILINRVGGFVLLFLSLYLTGPRGLSPALAGTIVGGYGIGGMVGTLLGGVLTDRWGRRRTLLLAHFAGAPVLLALGLVGSLPAVAVFTALAGAVNAMPAPALVATIVDIVPGPDRTRAFNLQFWAFNIGVAGASMLAGLFAELDFLLLFALNAAATLVAGGLVLWRIPETLPRPDVVPIATERGGLRVALTDRVFLVFVGLTLALATLGAQTTTMLPLAMAEDGLRPSTYGLVVSLGGTLVVFGQLFVPRLIAGRRAGSVLALALLLLGLGYGSVAFANSLGAYLLAALVWTAGAMLAAPPNATVIAELSPPLLRGRYQAVFYLTFSAATFLAPALGGISLQYLGSWHWGLCGALGVLAAAGHLWASGPRERRLATRTADRQSQHTQLSVARPL